MISLGLQFAAGQVEVDLTEGPDAAPSSVSSYTISGDVIGVQWVNGDAEAETQIALNDGSAPDSGDIQFTAPPGATNWQDTGLNANLESNRCTWWARHVRNGQFSSWSAAGEHVDGCTPPVDGGGEGGTQV